MQTPSTTADLASLRSQIDAIDTQIIELLSQRLQIVHQVGKLKAASPKTSFIRPAREATMVKHLIQQAAGHYQPEVISRIWRSIITSSLYAEQPFQLAVESAPHHQDNYWLAREYFGSFVPTILHPHAHDIIHCIQNDPSFVGVVSPEGNWWQDLSHGVGAPYGIQVFACIPSVYMRHAPRPARAFAIAQITPEETGDDISLLSLQTCQDNAWVHFKAACDKHRITCLSYQQGQQALLVTVEGYITGMHNPILLEIQRMTGAYVTRIIPMGCYARQVDV